MVWIVDGVEKNSIAEKHGIKAGDGIISMNGETILDYIDYAFFMGEERLAVRLKKKDGSETTVLIQKEDWEDLGLSFAQDNMGAPIRCENKCIFCFVDQLPRAMRKTLYVKDDDWRHSFLMGNYVTLTNLSEADTERIIKRKTSPLFVSVHAMDEAIRTRMLGNPNAPALLPLLVKLVQNGIQIHAQIVVCEGINDGEVLERTVRDLYALHPGVASLAIVPVGLTRYREKLYLLSKVSRENANEILNKIHALQKEFLRTKGTRFVFASDELYIRAEQTLPEYLEYEDFMQIENGVGLIAQFLDETEQGMADISELKYKDISVATGEDFAPFMKEIAKKLHRIYNIDINVYTVKNEFFGEQVTVTGLLTGRDIISQLKGKKFGEKLFLSGSMFREFEDVTLDDMSLEEMAAELDVDCETAPPDGYEWINMLAKEIK